MKTPRSSSQGVGGKMNENEVGIRFKVTNFRV
jgi:hypothetical protein